MWRLQMEEMYVQDLSNATEIVLDLKRKVRLPASRAILPCCDEWRRKYRPRSSGCTAHRKRGRCRVYE